MWKLGIVLVHVEGDQRLKRADGVERVQVQPLMFQRTPPRFDHRVGIRDLGHREKPCEEPGINQFVDSAVMVFASTVGEQGGLLAQGHARARKELAELQATPEGAMPGEAEAEGGSA